MKKYLRAMCLAFAVLMILSAVSCAENSDDEKNSAGNDVSQTSESETDAKDLSYVSELPSSVKFDGETVRILSLDSAGLNDELYVEEGNTGNNVNDAVYARNLAIEDRLGIDLEITLDSNAMANVENNIKAGGSDAMQIYSDSINFTVRSMIKGYFYDLSEVENLDVEKKYWTQGFRDIASYGKENKQYLITGAPSLSLYRFTFVTIFNKDYFEDAGWEDLYTIVENGDWTLDYQFSLISDVYQELDGKTGITEGDFVGLITGKVISIDPYLTACGIHMIKKDAGTGRWYFDGSTQERVASMVDKLKKIYNDSNGVYAFDSESTVITEKFASEEGAMATIELWFLEQAIGQIGFNYGIVPMPKFDTNQERYYSYVQDSATSFGILTCAAENDLPMLGAFLDQLGYESYQKVVPEYYGRSLSYKFLQDEESQKMLNLIYETTEYDFVGAFSAILNPVIRDEMRTVVTSSADIVGSSYAKWKRGMENTLDRKFNALLDSFDH